MASTSHGTTDVVDTARAPPASTLLARPVKVVNIGLERSPRSWRAQSVPVVQVEWAPPAGGNAKLAALLAKLGS